METVEREPVLVAVEVQEQSIGFDGNKTEIDEISDNNQAKQEDEVVVVEAKVEVSTELATKEEKETEENKEQVGEKNVQGTEEGKELSKEVNRETQFAKVKAAFMMQAKCLMAIYYMKNDGMPAEILPGLYLGSVGSAFSKKILQEHKIEHILCCCTGVKCAYPQDFKYKVLELLDTPSEDITRYFHEASEYLHNILTTGQKVLVHCYAGKSRSTTIMISYLLKYHNMTVDQALEMIKAKRPVVQPNMGFLKQLRDFEAKLKENAN